MNDKKHKPKKKMPDFNTYSIAELEQEVNNPSGPGLGEEAQEHLDYRNNALAGYINDIEYKRVNGIGSNPLSPPPPPPGS